MSDELVERVAAVFDKMRFIARPVTSDELARAALAIIEPAVREECAKVAEREIAAVRVIVGCVSNAIRAGAKP